MKEYYKKQNGEFYLEETKQKILSKINQEDPETFIKYLEKFDVPWIPCLWEQYFKGKRKYTFGKYLALMKLCHWKNYRYKDSEWLNKQLLTYWNSSRENSDNIH